MKITTLIACSLITIFNAILLTGCSSTPYVGPSTLENGKVYYRNFATCASYCIQNDNTTVTCYDKDFNLTGTMQPMTQEALANYYYNRMVAEQEQARRSQAIRELGNTLQKTSQMYLNAVPQVITTPSPMPVYRPTVRQGQTVRCYTFGNIVKCY